MKKLLVVCGATATGKTGLAAKLARKFNGELVSADSRQVYKHMDIGTGKDRPEGTIIWGYDLAEPTEEFSVSRYVEIARKLIADIHSRGRLPILVGGTGLYIKGVVDGIATINVPRDEILRGKLERLSIEALRKKLQEVDPLKLDTMNVSDRANMRRLIRAIEVAGSSPTVSETPEYDSLFIGLKLAKDELDRRINARVDERTKNVFQEINKLLQLGVTWDSQSMSSLGYKQLQRYYAKTQTRSEATNAWKRAEMKYAKRQRTWFKRDSRIKWFDVSVEGFALKIEKLVKKWYASK